MSLISVFLKKKITLSTYKKIKISIVFNIFILKINKLSSRSFNFRAKHSIQHQLSPFISTKHKYKKRFDQRVKGKKKKPKQCTILAFRIKTRLDMVSTTKGIYYFSK